MPMWILTLTGMIYTACLLSDESETTANVLVWHTKWEDRHELHAKSSFLPPQWIGSLFRDPSSRQEVNLISAKHSTGYFLIFLSVLFPWEAWVSHSFYNH